MAAWTPQLTNFITRHSSKNNTVYLLYNTILCNNSTHDYQSVCGRRDTNLLHNCLFTSIIQLD